MKQFQLKTLLAAVAILSVLSACHKDKVNPDSGPKILDPGILVVNQGGITHNNSTLTYYDYTTKATSPDIFASVNSRGLGDTGNDGKIYGSKMYITVNYSSTLEIVDARTIKSIKQIKMVDGATNRQPRYVAFDKGKAFISSYDGTVAVLDTATLTIDKYIKVGRNPEQMVISNGKLYVANSGGLDLSNPDKTVSVINLTSLSEIKKIDIATTNPINIAADAYGDVYVIAYGTDYPAKPKLIIIDNSTDLVKSTTDIDAGYGTQFIINGDRAYYLTDAGKVKVYNVKNETVVSENFVTDGTTFIVAFALSVNPSTGEVYVADAIDYSSNGKLYAFDKNGKNENATDKKGYLTETGINPGAIIFINK